MRLRTGRVFRYKKSLIVVLVIAVVAGLILLIVKNLEAPAVGSVVQTPTNKAEAVDPLAKPGKFAGKYITFSYPAHYQTTPTALNGTYLELASYHFVGVAGRQINVGVYRGDIDTDGPVDLRRKHPDQYKETTSSVGTEFTKIDGTEDTFFISHNDMIATVSVSGPGANSSSDATFVVSSLRWQ